MLIEKPKLEKVKEFIYDQTEETMSECCFLKVVCEKVFLGEIVRTQTLANSKVRGYL